MALQPSGNKQVELVSIETEKLYFTIKGKYRDTDFDYSEDVFKDILFYKCIPENELINISTYSEKVMFWEYQDYQIIIEDKGNHAIEFYHENKLIRDQITYTTKSNRVLAGSINFKSDIGMTEFIILVDNKEHLFIRIEVFPSKIDYKKDYLNILLDVNEEIYNLSFDFLKRTYLNMTLSEKEGNSLTEFFSIFKYIYDNLIKSINVIVNQPHHSLVKEERILPYHKLKKTSSETVRWLEKNTTSLVKIDNNYIPIKALNTNKTVTVDTYENQYLKYMIEMTIARLEELKRKYGLLYRADDEVFLNRVNTMVKKLNSYIKSSFLNKVSSYQPRESFSLVFKMAPGYKDVYKYYLMLKKGLIMHGDVFKMSMKEMATLYEYWCFIKINSILRKKYKLIQNDLVKINNSGVFVTLKKGSETQVTYQNPKNGELFTISYNSLMKSETIPQKPDNVFSIKKDGNDVVYNYIFDAKYRINFANQGSRYREYYKKPGPEEDDINTMHRYRDAIIYQKSQESNIERNIFGAFVLFPYNNEQKYREHKFYKSIDLVNVGGIPFLPNSTKIMEEFLDELIEESSLSTYERSLKQVGQEYYLKDQYFSDRSVLVGSLSSKEQLHINLENKFYHTKLKNVDLNNHLIKTIAIGQSKRLFGNDAGIKYYGNVKDIKLVKRSEIKEIPKESDELYIRFEIEEWKELDRPLRVEGFQVIRVLYTTDYLLNNSETVSELCIKDKEEFRLWMELKRLDIEVKAVAQDNNISNSTKIRGFSYSNKDIYIIDDMIRVISNGRPVEFTRKDFRKNPKLIVKMITQLEEHH